MNNFNNNYQNDKKIFNLKIYNFFFQKNKGKKKVNTLIYGSIPYILR